MPGLFCTLNRSLQFSEVSSGLESTLGSPAARLKGHSFLDWVAASTRESVRRSLTRVLEEPGIERNLQVKCERQDAASTTLTWLWVCHEEVLYGSAQPVAAPVERDLAGSGGEPALRLSTILESMTEGVIVQDRDGQVIRSNAAAERILRVSAPLLGEQNAHGPPLAPLRRRDGTTFPDEERPAARVLRTGIPVTNSVMGLARPDGKTTWISTNATTLRANADAPIQGALLTFRDITESVRLEEELKASLDTFRSLVTSLPLGIAVSHGPIMRYVNRALVDILGYDDPSELEGRETGSVIHPNSKQALIERYSRMASGVHPDPGVLECKKKDGSSVLVEVTSLPTTFRGDPAILAIIRDVTESTRAKQEKERSEARFRALVNFAPVGIFETDSDGRCIYMNQRGADITGVSVAEAMGSGWLQGVHPDDRATILAKRAEARVTGAHLEQDLRFVNKRGIANVQVRSLPLAIDGTVNGYLGVLVDLTELRKAELALVQSEESFRTLTDRAPVGIAVRVGPKLIFGNPALARLFGAATQEELIGKDIVNAATPDSREALRARLERLTAGEVLKREVFNFSRPDGSIAMLEFDSQNIDYRGTPATMSLIRDVTELERTRAERDAAHAALLESLEQKETLIKEIHHRVKNNLQVIASLLRLGRRNVKDLTTLSVFEDSIARVHSIGRIHEQLYQSRDLDHIEMPTYLEGLVSELVRANATPNRVSASVSSDRVFLTMNQCVPIGLIVNELVSNALKHAFKDHGALRAPAIVVELRELDHGYELSVRDNGVGFGADTEQDDSLGLLLVKSLTTQLQGQVHLLQEDGSVWRIAFPKTSAT